MGRLIIAGSRGFEDKRGREVHLANLQKVTVKVQDALDEVFSGYYTTSPSNVEEVVSGGARGADRLGELWAYLHDISVTQFIPDWESLGKRAGMDRNRRMAEYAAARSNGMLVAFWDGESRGTKNMIEEAEKVGLYIKIVKVRV